MTAAERMHALMQECRKSPTQTPHARFSNALGCLRSHVYDFRLLDAGKWPLVVEKPARWNFAAAVGTAVGDLIERAAQRLGATTQARAELGVVAGNLDIEWPDAIWDLKWVGEFAWRKANGTARTPGVPDEKHVAQVNAYAVARNKPRWALVYLPIHLLGKGEALEYAIHEGEADTEKARRDVTERWARVEQHRADGTLPEREQERDVCERLKCIHRSECWEAGQ